MINYYIVGGFVRDEILGVKSKDVDFAVEAESYEAMRDDILSKGYTIFQERPEYFAIRGRHPVYGGVDFVLCRKDGFYSDNRRPDDVQIGDIYDDLRRRDFSVNAIAKTEDGEYIDPHGGIKDISNMVLHCVGKMEDRFMEDPLRMLRAIRFKIVRGFSLDSDIREALKNPAYAALLHILPIERVYEELVKCYEHNSWETSMFFGKHQWLNYVIFHEMGLTLVPRIREI